MVFAVSTFRISGFMRTTSHFGKMLEVADFMLHIKHISNLKRNTVDHSSVIMMRNWFKLIDQISSDFINTFIMYASKENCNCLLWFCLVRFVDKLQLLFRAEFRFRIESLAKPSKTKARNKCYSRFSYVAVHFLIYLARYAK